MYQVVFTNKFKKDYKLSLKRGNSEQEIKKTMQMLVEEIELPAKYREHKLIGEYADCMECHIRPDLLMVYSKSEEDKSICFVRIGSHSDLFG
jgi:mRNA interferase YafQ